MTTNHYFSNNSWKPQQDMADDLVTEFIKIGGMDLIYIKRESNEDTLKRHSLFGEDYIGEFKKRYPIEMYLENADGWEGEGDLLSKFGVILRDTGRFTVSKRRFQQETLMERPLEGDLLYIPLTNSLFEITYISTESPFYQFGNRYTYTITVELFQYSEEKFSTGISDIDRITEFNAFNIDFNVDDIANLDNFVDGESVTVEGTSFGGTIEDLDGFVHVSDVTDANAPTNGILVGSDSGTTVGISAADSFEMRNNPFAQNELFEEGGGDVIDNSESGPYGSF